MGYLHSLGPYLEEAHDVANIFLKSKIYHPIRLIHAQVLAVIKGEPFLLQHIDEDRKSVV